MIFKGIQNNIFSKNNEQYFKKILFMLSRLEMNLGY